MRKPTIDICENKDADQLCSNCTADQRLCFRFSDSTIPPLLNSKISSFWPASVAVQASLCQTCSETTLLVFPRGGSNDMTAVHEKEPAKAVTTFVDPYCTCTFIVLTDDDYSCVQNKCI